MGKLRSLKQVLRQWNKEVFGNIDTKIAAAKHSLAAIQKDIYEMGDSDSLMDSELEATVELNQCLAQQHASFAQKNRNSWLRDGDRNTAFFHRIHRIRKARAGINTQNIDGVITTDLNVISEHIFWFYSDLFRASNKEPPDFALVHELISPLNLELRPAMASSRLACPSYLLYADDVLIFCTASRANIHRMKEILDKYAIVSGQVFNLAKIKAYFGKHVPLHNRWYARTMLGISVGELPFTYLGYQFSEERPRPFIYVVLLIVFLENLQLGRAQHFQWPAESAW
ncbi:hypothetical protein ACS0TY_008191 [Phlomoides rotata]